MSEEQRDDTLIELERKHIEQLDKIGVRINHLESQIVDLVDLLDAEQLRKIVLKNAII